MARAEILPEAQLAGELTDEDLDLLGEERGIQPPQIQKVRATHHALARVLAAGASPVEASEICGISVNRISILQKDPMFAELLSHYTGGREHLAADVVGQFREVGLSALGELRDRLLDAPESIKTADLLAVINGMMDRAGHSPVQRSVSLHLDGDTIGELTKAASFARENIRVVSRGPGAEVSNPFFQPVVEIEADAYSEQGEELRAEGGEGGEGNS